MRSLWLTAPVVVIRLPMAHNVRHCTWPWCSTCTAKSLSKRSRHDLYLTLESGFSAHLDAAALKTGNLLRFAAAADTQLLPSRTLKEYYAEGKAHTKELRDIFVRQVRVRPCRRIKRREQAQEGASQASPQPGGRIVDCPAKEETSWAKKPSNVPHKHCSTPVARARL